jgi:hypothetical protein
MTLRRKGSWRLCEKCVPPGLKEGVWNYSLQIESRRGTAENYPGCIPGVPLLLKWDYSRFEAANQDHVLGNFQPSLRDLIWREWFSHAFLEPSRAVAHSGFTGCGKTALLGRSGLQPGQR